MAKKYHRFENEEKKKTGAFVLLGAFIIAVIGIVVVSILMDGGEDKAPVKENNNAIVKIGGVKCRAKQNIDTYLFMGVDAKGTVEDSEKEGELGQADMITVLVVDRAKNTYALLPINRDTITAVDSLDENGDVLATTDIQLALAHANGTNQEEACENTVKAVSHLLHGQSIDEYAALHMDGIGLINHFVGGVSVTIEDDFSDSDKTLKKGQTVKLTDQQAINFLHDRMNVGDGTNEARMRRQNAYMNGLREIMKEETLKDSRYPIKMYRSLKDYTVSTMSSSSISRISKAMIKNKYLGRFEIEGTSEIDDYGFVAFTPNRKSLDDIVIKLFYDRVK